MNDEVGVGVGDGVMEEIDSFREVRPGVTVDDKAIDAVVEAIFEAFV